MRLGFIDGTQWQYDVETPLREPLGGSQSALCYLTAALADRGHEVVIFNGNSEPVVKRGVTCRSAEGVKGDVLNAFDVVVSVNSGTVARMMRDAFKVTVPLVLWEHHGDWQPGAQVLAEPEIVKPWTAIAFVSETQRAAYRKRYKTLEGVDTVVMHNGVSPAFDRVMPREAVNPPVLFYTSTPFRGLDVLLSVFPMIRKAVKGTHLIVFSSMRVYRALERPDFLELYAAAHDMEGVDYRGSVGQAQLAEELAHCTALAHPSTFPECHSIAAIEALALGAAVLTTDLGGQLEATRGYGTLIPYKPEYETNRRALMLPYAEMVIASLKEMQKDPDLAHAHRLARRNFARSNYRWADKAADWERFFSLF